MKEKFIVTIVKKNIPLLYTTIINVVISTFDVGFDRMTLRHCPDYMTGILLVN